MSCNVNTLTRILCIVLSEECYINGVANMLTRKNKMQFEEEYVFFHVITKNMRCYKILEIHIL